MLKDDEKWFRDLNSEQQNAVVAVVLSEERKCDLNNGELTTLPKGFLLLCPGGVESLDIGSFEWWSEGLHGIRCGHGADCGTGGSTSFPQPILSAASFNRTLWRAIGGAISTEFRALANTGHAFLSVFAPNINIFRAALPLPPTPPTPTL